MCSKLSIFSLPSKLTLSNFIMHGFRIAERINLKEISVFSIQFQFGITVIVICKQIEAAHRAIFIIIMQIRSMEAHMEQAFVEARSALAIGEVPVGCVFVCEDSIIARGGNQVNATKNATRHAEFVCIDQVLDYCKENELNAADIFHKISVVVTVEPCIMCSAALHDLGVKEIVFGCANDRFGGKTVVDVPQVVNHSLPIVGGVRAEEAMDLLKDFYKGENPSAPVAKPRK